MNTEQPFTTSLAGWQGSGDISIVPSLTADDSNPFRSRGINLNSLYPKNGTAAAEADKTMGATAVKSTPAQVNRNTDGKESDPTSGMPETELRDIVNPTIFGKSTNYFL